ncbi:MAG TPA: GNAT family N-acetyltransferase [Panacibacter sp.]|nr:GNAT family N-acetyltransferase [Panacibacter sp.]HNP43040.1 GNAT family N-acetyltransferase [Panacibacter sp.]
MNDVIIRPWKREDAQALAAIANNRNIWNNLRDHLPHPYTVMDAMQWITSCMPQEPVLNFAVLCKGELVGSIGCVPKSDVYRKTMEIGYFIGEQFKGRGIATEAVRILLHYIAEQFDIVRVYAEVFAFNRASMQVLQKNGFILESIRRKAVIKNNVITDDCVWVKFIDPKR